MIRIRSSNQCRPPQTRVGNKVSPSTQKTNRTHAIRYLRGQPSLFFALNRQILMNLLESWTLLFTSCWIQTTFVYYIYVGQSLHRSPFHSWIDIASVASLKKIVSINYLRCFRQKMGLHHWARQSVRQKVQGRARRASKWVIKPQYIPFIYSTSRWNNPMILHNLWSHPLSPEKSKAFPHLSRRFGPSPTWSKTACHTIAMPPRPSWHAGLLDVWLPNLRSSPPRCFPVSPETFWWEKWTGIQWMWKIWGFPKMLVPNNHGFSY